MSCINIDIKRLDALSIRFGVERVFAVSAERIGRISASVCRQGRLAVQACRTGKMHVSATVVCDTGYYLLVSPDRIWLTPANGFVADVAIFSNTKWGVAND